MTRSDEAIVIRSAARLVRKLRIDRLVESIAYPGGGLGGSWLWLVSRVAAGSRG